MHDATDRTAATVNTAFTVSFDYPVHFVRGAFAPGNAVLAETFDRRGEGRRHRVAAVLDEGLLAARPDLADAVAAYFHAHPDRLELAGPPLTYPGGPAAKTDYGNLQTLLWTLGNLHLDRQSFVLAVGGGSMLDAVGFGASLVHRGLRLVRMPSTVLAQCDAGIGVKNGLDEHGQKNFLGTFAPPFAVLNDAALLRTLDDAHWRGGVAEAFKVALIRDAALFAWLEEHAAALRERDAAVMEQAIHACARIHLNHIAGGGDPFEMGSARPLDFGHWAAHRLEILSGHTIGHGQAVAVGIALDCAYAVRKGLLEQDALERTVAALERAGLPVYVDTLRLRRADGELEVLRGLADFREHLGGRLTVTLPDGIGRGIEVHHMNRDWIVDGIDWLRQHAAESRARGNGGAA